MPCWLWRYIIAPRATAVAHRTMSAAPVGRNRRTSAAGGAAKPRFVRARRLAHDLSAQVAAVPRRVVPLLAVLAAAVVAAIDFRLGAEISTSILYVLPVGIASWYGDRRVGTVISILSAGLWISADLAAGVTYSHPTIAVWNTLVRLGMFLIIANLLVSFHTAQNAAERLAQTDELTGLGNSRRFLTRLAEEIARTSRSRRPFTLVYTDLDNFKQVNDRNGHAAGDHALIVVAETLTGALRKTDLIARLGGDEFAILLAETDEEAAKLVCSQSHQKLLGAMRAHGWPITFSSGAVTFVAAPPSADEAITVADALMYQVKAQGKNRVEYCTWPSSAA